MKMFKADILCGNKIEEIKVDRDSGANVWIEERRRPKTTSWYRYFPTREAAKDWLLFKRTMALEEAQASVKNVERLLNEAKAL